MKFQSAAGTVMTVEFELDVSDSSASTVVMSSSPARAVSFGISGADQAEVDYLGEQLTDGGEEGPCGWHKDKFSQSWLVVPSGMDEMLAGHRSIEGAVQVNVTVVGSGNGGLAVAAEWSQQGNRVSVYSAPEHAHHNIDGINAQGGIRCQGRLDGLMPIAYAGSDIEAAMDGAEVVFVVGPAFATEPHATALAPHLHSDTVVIICPTSCVGSLAFKKAAGLSISDDSVLVGETSTLPYACRADGEGTVHIYHRFDTGVFAAAVPRTGTPRLLDILRQVYPATEEAASILQTTLQNGNPVIHPAVTLLNAGLLERTSGAFKFYEEGITPSVGRLMEAVDRERLAIAAALELKVLSEPDLGVLEGYMVESNYSTGYSTAPGFQGIGAPDHIDSRYLTEDISYTMVFWTDLARSLDVPTPVMDAVIQIGSVVLGHDVRADGARTMSSMGLSDMSRQQLREL